MSTGTQHTRGPLTVKRNRGRGNNGETQVFDEAGGSVGTFGEKADAELFAAAPVTAERLERAVTALELAEGFISGFEDDEMQEGVGLLLAIIRASMAENGLFEAQQWAAVDADPEGCGDENEDRVTCTWCEFDGVVKMGAEVCPKCRKRGTLADAPAPQPENREPCRSCEESSGEFNPATHLAACSGDQGKTLRWLMICEDHASTWRDGGDWGSPVIELSALADMLPALKKAHNLILDMGRVIRSMDDAGDHSEYWTNDGEYCPHSDADFIYKTIQQAEGNR